MRISGSIPVGMVICSSIWIAIASGAGADRVPATQPADAAALYHEAAQAIVVDSPRASNLNYPSYPPFGAEWDKLASAAWEKNVRTRALARRARSVEVARWPANLACFDDCKRVANEVGDAAVYQHLTGNDVAAVESIRDLLHMSKLLRHGRGADDAVALLVAGGVDALAMKLFLTIASALNLTTDPNDNRAMQIADARQLMRELLGYQAPAQQLRHLFGARWDEEAKKDPKVVEAIIDALNRANAERTFAAMSLACHLFHNDKGRWPKFLGELVPGYIERVPIDPWGDGKQTFGYALFEGGLPGGGDRPLVYSRAESRDGLFIRMDAPQYGWYVGDGSGKAMSQQKKGGQFRDVARWVPTDLNKRGQTTRPLSSIGRTY